MMMNRFPRWIFGLIAIGLLVLIPFVYLQPRKTQAPEAAAYVPVKRVHVDHRDIVKGVFKTGQDVTRACLACHKDAAAELMKTTHWTWESKTVTVPAARQPALPGLESSDAAQMFVNQADAPPCPTCGMVMVRNGACYKCGNCGTVHGCS